MYSILLIEDDAALALGIEYALKSEGFYVECANSIIEGKQKFKNKTFQILLLDVMLPDGNGYDFCREIRKSSDISIIFLTACDEEANIVLGLDLGGDDYISKPVRIKELISRINAVLRRNKPSTNSEIIKTGDIEIHPLKCLVLKNGEEILLTSVEYKLLLALIKNAGNVMSRNLLLERLWDIDGEFVDDNTLSVYIKRLREKIEEEVKNPKYISTLRGLGYKWNLEVRGD